MGKAAGVWVVPVVLVFSALRMPEGVQNDSIDSINVVMYSYRDKDAIKALENLMKKWSGKIFLFVHWHDQYGTTRNKMLEDLINSYDYSNGAYVKVA